MKLTILLTFLTFGLFAQGPASLINVASPLTQARSQQISLANAYFGSKLQNVVTGDNLSDNFLFEADIVYQIPIQGKWHLPIVTTTGIPISENGLSKIEAGLYPWTFISDKLVFHGGASIGLDLVGSETPQNFKLLAGLEGILNTGTTPLTLSVTPVVNFLNLDRGTHFSLEATAIAPLTQGLGVIIEYQVPFKSELTNSLSIGVISLQSLGG